MAYFCVHSCTHHRGEHQHGRTLAVAAYFALSVLKRRAISGTSGSSGLASVSSDEMDSSTCARSQHSAPPNTRLGNGQGGAPLVLENVEADAARRIDVRVVDLGLEHNLGRLEGIVCSCE